VLVFELLFDKISLYAKKSRYTIPMGPYVHRDLTIKWAGEAGFSPEDAEIISRANLEIDKKRLAKPWIHFPLFGAFLFSRLLARRARRRRDLILLAYALHAVQDGYSHGWILPFRHTPELDEWSHAAPDTQERIKIASLDMLNRHLSK
jgi:hypothetical protein